MQAYERNIVRISQYLHSLLSVHFVYCAALWDRLEGVTSIVDQPFDWQLLSADK